MGHFPPTPDSLLTRAAALAALGPMDLSLGAHYLLGILATQYLFFASEKEMATHSSVLAWRIPGTGEPGGLPSMGSHRVGHD